LPVGIGRALVTGGSLPAGEAEQGKADEHFPCVQ
jgi:hypothetical protein